MSARMPSDITDVVEPGLHEWLTWMLDPDADPNDPPDRVPVRLVERCRAAVDPLEIAAALEVNGISHAVATERYHRGDVFSLAHSIWNRMPFEPAEVVERSWGRDGGTWRDLVRGLLHVLAVVILLGIGHAFDHRLERWSSVLGITLGWGAGQAAAHLTTVASARVTGTAAALLRDRLLAGTAVSALVLSTVASVLRGTDTISFLVAATLPPYMVASAMLLARQADRALALALAPGVVGAVLGLVTGADSDLRWLVAALAAISLAAVVLLARTGGPSEAGATAEALGTHHLADTAAHLVHGLLIGAVASALIIDRRPEGISGSLVTLVVSLPVLATLGLMEWHLRTFRARLGAVADTRRSLSVFATAARAQVVSTLVIYGAMVAIVATAVGVGVDPRGVELWTFLGVQVLFAVACLADLCLVALGAVRSAVAGWAVAVAAGVAWILVDVRVVDGEGLEVARRPLDALDGRVLDDVVWHGALVGTAAGLALLLVRLFHVAATPRHH